MRCYGLLVSMIILLCAGSGAVASEIVYHPVNPTFGGNPLNGNPLLSQAQAQGQGVKSGSQSPDLSGLTSALSNLGSSSPIIIANPTGSSTTNGIPSNP
jgi:curli production assembly/transport component CsgF